MIIIVNVEGNLEIGTIRIHLPEIRAAHTGFPDLGRTTPPRGTTCFEIEGAIHRRVSDRHLFAHGLLHQLS